MGMLAFLACSGAILWWGWSSDRLEISVLMSALVALASLWRPIPSLSPKAARRSAEMTFLLIVLGAFWVYLQRQSIEGNLAIHALSLSPYFLFPKLFWHSLCQKDSRFLSGSAFDGSAGVRSWLSEARVSRGYLDAPFRFDYPFAYLFFAIFSAAIQGPARSGIAGAAFFVFLAIGLSALFAARGEDNPKPRPFFRFPVFFALALVSIVAMLAGGSGIQKTQEILEDRMSRFFDRFSHLSNPNIAKTSIGKNGRMSLPNKLLYRVEWKESSGYLFDGAFGYTADGALWRANAPAADQRAFFAAVGSMLAGSRRILPNEDGSFSLFPGSSDSENLPQASFSAVLSRERAALPLPSGAVSIFGLPLPFLEISSQNVVSTQGSPGFVKFSSFYDPARLRLAPPSDLDLALPPALRSDIAAFVDAHQLRGLPPARAAAKIIEIFSRWEYTLDLETPDGDPRSLRDFLSSDRRGHCEYFASASALALRELGIPSRFVSGYLVSERDPFEDVFWVRSSDAHAWASYWDGSKWAYLDATPAGWPEARPADPLAWLTDWLDRLQYAIDTANPADLSVSLPAPSALIPWLAGLLAILAAIIASRRIRLRFRRPDPKALCEELVLEVESLSGLARSPSESSPRFLRRAASGLESADSVLRAASIREALLFSRSPPADSSGAIEAALRDVRAERRRARPQSLSTRRKAPRGP